MEETSDLHGAQPVTFESMRLAKVHAGRDVDVELYSAHFPEDCNVVPAWITGTRHLGGSVLDIGNFSVRRKLPLIRDILDRLYEVSEADYFVYTNVDIALMPHFYTSIAQLVDTGIDAMVINRRTIAKFPCDPAYLPLMWAQAGEKHPGYDCFIFRRDAYPRFELGNACIGANWIGRVILANLFVHAKNFRIFEDCHVTFHLGDDRAWKNTKFSDYDRHNQDELLKILDMFREDGSLEKNSLLSKFHENILISRKKPRYSEKISKRLLRWVSRNK